MVTSDFRSQIKMHNKKDAIYNFFSLLFVHVYSIFMADGKSSETSVRYAEGL